MTVDIISSQALYTNGACCTVFPLEALQHHVQYVNQQLLMSDTFICERLFAITDVCSPHNQGCCQLGVTSKYAFVMHAVCVC